MASSGGDRRVAFVDAAVGKDQNAGSVADGDFCLVGDSRDRFVEVLPGMMPASASAISKVSRSLRQRRRLS